MKSSNLIMGIASVIIGIVVITTVMIPVVNSASQINVTYNNDEYVATFDKLDTFTLSSGAINDMQVATILESMEIAYGLVVTDCFIAVVYLNSGGTYYGNWNVFLKNGSMDQYNVSVVNNAYSIINISTEDVIETGTLTYAYVLSVGGEYGLIDGSFRLNESSEIVYFTKSGADHGVSYGTVNNMTTSFKYVNSETVEDFIPTINYTVVPRSHAIEVSSNETIIAPISSSYIEYGEGAVYSIVAILPLLAVIGLLIGGTFVLFVRR